MPKTKTKDRTIVKEKAMRCMMTEKQFSELTKLSKFMNITRSEVVRRLITEALTNMPNKANTDSLKQ